jgi:hypothetical protein
LDPDRPAVGSYRRTTDFRVSPTDPDATPMRTKTGTVLGYHDHYVIDGGRRRIILAALVTPADVMENVPLRNLLWRVCFRRKFRLHQVTGDTTYGTVENIVAVENAGIRAFFPLPDIGHRTAFFGRDAFTYDVAADVYQCPQGQSLGRRTSSRSRAHWRWWRGWRATGSSATSRQRVRPLRQRASRTSWARPGLSPDRTLRGTGECPDDPAPVH